MPTSSRTIWTGLLLLLLTTLTSAATPLDARVPAPKKKVIILGATGSVATVAIDLLKNDPDINLTLFVRDKSRLQNTGIENARIVVGDVFEYNGLRDAIKGQDVVYANLAGDLGRMAKNIVKAMNETGVKQLIFITSRGIYQEPVSPVLVPYRQAADVIEASNLDYTILRPTWYTDVEEVDYEITPKGTPEKGSVISRKSLATFIQEVIRHPEKYRRQSLGVNKSVK